MLHHRSLILTQITTEPQAGAFPAQLVFLTDIKVVVCSCLAAIYKEHFVGKREDKFPSAIFRRLWLWGLTNFSMI